MLNEHKEQRRPSELKADANLMPTTLILFLWPVTLLRCEERYEIQDMKQAAL